MTKKQREMAQYLNEFVPKEMIDFEAQNVILSNARREECLDAEFKQVILHLIDWLKGMGYSARDIAECILFFISGDSCSSPVSVGASNQNNQKGEKK